MHLKLALLLYVFTEMQYSSRSFVNGHSPVQLSRTSSTVANSTEMRWITYEIVYTRHARNCSI